MQFCKVRNVNVEVILATLTSESDLLILRSVNICSILYSKCLFSHSYTWSVNNHTYIHIRTYVHVWIYKCLMVYNQISARNHGGSEFLDCNIPIIYGPYMTSEFDKQPRGLAALV